MASEKEAGKERMFIDVKEGLLTETDLSILLDLPVRKIVSYIEDKKLPGRKIGVKGSPPRTLTSIKQLISFAEGKSGEKQ